MRIFHSSLNLRTFLHYYRLYPDKKLNVLKSYAMLDSDFSSFCKTHRDKIDMLALDSGAWSYNNAQASIPHLSTITPYRDYLQSFGHYFDLYFNLDRVFDDDVDELNYQNQLQLENAGLHPIPVVHDPMGDEIDFYIDHGYETIALGSKQNGNRKVLSHAFEKFSRADTNVHLFGNMKFSSLTDFPVWSCDTTAWAQRGKWGLLYYWNENNPGLDKTDKIYLEEQLSAAHKHKHYYSSYEFRSELDQYLNEELKISPTDFYGIDGEFYKRIANLHFYVKLEERINEIHRSKGFNT
jgi:hypothetical protein